MDAGRLLNLESFQISVLPLISRRCFVNCMSNLKQTNMDTIEEKLQEDVGTRTSGDYMDGFKMGFEKGVLFAQRWIPVEEELPTPGIDGSIYSPYILLKIEGLDYPVVGYFVIARDDSFFYSMNYSVDCDKITHWRPIEFK